MPCVCSAAEDGICIPSVFWGDSVVGALWASVQYCMRGCLSVGFGEDRWAGGYPPHVGVLISWWNTQLLVGAEDGNIRTWRLDNPRDLKRVLKKG